MKSLMALIFAILPIVLIGQNEFYGTWQAIDDKDGEPSSYIEIYEENGKLHGKIAKILEDVGDDVVCDLCEGNKKDQPILGLEIIWDRRPKVSPPIKADESWIPRMVKPISVGLS